MVDILRLRGVRSDPNPDLLNKNILDPDPEKTESRTRIRADPGPGLTRRGLPIIHEFKLWQNDKCPVFGGEKTVLMSSRRKKFQLIPFPNIQILIL